MIFSPSKKYINCELMHAMAEREPFQPLLMPSMDHEKVSAAADDYGSGSKPAEKNEECDGLCAGLAVLLALGLFVFLLLEQVFVFCEYQREKHAPEYFNKYGFELQKINITDFSATGSDLAGGCTIVFNVTNKCGMDFLYERGIVSVYFDKTLIWATTTSPFYQLPLDTAALEVVAPKTTITLPTGYVPRAMLRRRKVEGDIGRNFEVRFTVTVRQGLSYYSTGTQPLDVRCSKIPTQFVNDTLIIGGPSSCVVQDGNHPLSAFQFLFS